MARREVAISYAQKGWQVIPLCWPDDIGNCACGAHHPVAGKSPLVRWKDVEITPERVAEWWAQWPEANIGLLLDKSNILVVDADSPAAVEEVEELGVEGAWVVQSWRGKHYLFRCPPELAGRRAVHKGSSQEIDILAGGYIVLPPSLHRAGVPYRWLQVTDTLVDAPEWAVRWLREAVTKEVALELPDTLPEVTLRELRVSDWWRKAIVQGLPAAAEKYKSRSELIFAAIRVLLQAGHSPAQIVSVLLNQEWALGDKIREKPDPVEAARQEVARCIAKGIEEKDVSSVQDVVLRGPDLVRLLKDDATEYLIHTIFPMGATAVLGGEPKSGKTTLAFHLVKAVLRGGVFLGHKAPRARSVIYVNYEMSVRTIAQMYVDIIGQDVGSWPLTVVKPSVPVTPALLDQYVQQSEAQTPGLIVIDPLFASLGLRGEEENQAGEVGPKLRALVEWSHVTGWALLILHHAHKGVGTGVNRLAGSRDIAAAPDLVWIWENLRTDEDPTRPGRLYLDGRAHAAQWYYVRLLRQVCERVDKDETTINTLLQLLADAGEEGMTVKEIAASLGVSQKDAVTLLNRAKDKIVTANSGGSVRHYRLAKAVPTSI